MFVRVMHKSSKQHTTKQELYGHLPPIIQTIQDEPDTLGTVSPNSFVIFSCELLHTSIGRPAKAYINQL